MKYLVFCLAFALTATYLIAFAKSEKLKKFRFYKQLLAGIVIAVFFVRYFCLDKHYAYGNIVGLNAVADILSLSEAGALLTVIADALSMTMFVTSVMSLFYDRLRPIDNFIKYVFPIGSVLCLIYVGDIHSLLQPSAFMGEAADLTKTLFSVLLMIECGIYLAISVEKWFQQITGFYFKDKRNFTVKAVLLSVIVGLLMFAVTMPNYFLQFTFGEVIGYYYAYKISKTHRVFIYLMFIIPLIIYFVLRNREEKVIRASLIYISVSVMVTFCVTYSFKNFTDISSWPFHLCNTALFVLPLCLIFRLKKVFYFTYFINVLGALFAMLMPNYSERLNLLNYEFSRFWLNHWCAFFFPLICVALGQFERPNIKLFGFSMLWFLLYFIFVLFLNVYFTSRGKEVDYFFINSDFIGAKLGNFGKEIFRQSQSITIGDYTYTFHALYQILYFHIYIILGFGMWFIYELFFTIAGDHIELLARHKKIRLDKLALKASLNGRSIEEPMNPDVGIRLELKNFSKRYGTNKYYSVSNASLTVYGGEIFGFLGPNGAGKSTIIKSIVGIQPITEGSIEICGYDCAKQPVMSKRQIGYVPDHYALYERLTGREYINYIADIYEVSEEDRNQRISEYVSLFQLESSIDNQIKTYSHGMKQKITIISALVHNPKLWILDEPLTGLDPNSIYQVKECMRRHARQGNIVFFSSHLIEVVEKLCDRVAIIKKGEIQCVASIDEIEENGSLEEFYMKVVGEENLDDEQKRIRQLKLSQEEQLS